MEVKLLYAPSRGDCIDTIYAACRQCYYSGFVGDQFPFDNIPMEKKAKLISRVIKSGHHSTIEHVVFTFGIKDLSRAAAQQLTRHRLANYSMQSQRYCTVSSMDMRIPPSIEKSEFKDEYEKLVNDIVNFYNKLIDNKIEPEDARSILPIGWNSNLVMTMNCRELLHFFSQRCCTQAQWEIRELANKMLLLCKDRLPEVFSAGGPKCLSLGYCNEGDRSCHLRPLKEEVFK